MPVVIVPNRDTGKHNTYKDNGYYGGWRCQEDIFRKLGHCEGNGSYLGADIPRLRPHRFFNGQAVYVDLLREEKGYGFKT